MQPCDDKMHSFVALDMTDRTLGQAVAGTVTPKYSLYCQKCGLVINATIKEKAVGA